MYAPKALSNEHKRHVKFAKREATLTKTLVPVIEQTLRESPSLEHFFVSRIKLSKEGGCITVFVSKLDNEPLSKAVLEALQMYKAPIRKLVADVLCAKWTPEINIRFDQKLEKVRHTDELINAVAERENSQTSVSLEATIEALTKSLNNDL